MDADAIRSVDRIVPLQEAVSRGLRHYFTGEPCGRGHMADRLVKGRGCTDCFRENTLRWRAANRDKLRECVRNYRRKNMATLRERNLERYYRNHEQYKSKHQEWMRANPEKKAQYSRKRHKHAVANGRNDLTADDVREIAALQGGRCALCARKVKLTVDHMLALSKGGENTRRNVQMLCHPCNSGKRDRDAMAYARTRGALL